MQTIPQTRGSVIVLLAVLLYMLAGWTTACQKSHPIVGLWRTNGPSNLLFDYREDGTVSLIEETQTYQMFHYQLKEEDVIHLYDGMGRRQVFRYAIDGDEMKYYLTSGPDEAKYTFRREQ